MKVYVVKDCMDSNKEFLAQGSTVEVDKSKEKKLFNLGLIEEFDSKKHTVKPSGDAKLEAELKSKDETIAKLEGFVEASISLAAKKVPDGWEEYKAK